MGRQWNPDAIRDFAMFESGPYTFRIDAINETRSRNTGVFCYQAILTCTDGKADFVGAMKQETFTMGTPEDPDWQDPETVGPGARGLKQMLKATGLDVTHPDLDELLAQATGQSVGAMVDKGLDKTNVMRDNVTRWFPAAGTPAPAAKPPATRPAPAPARPAPTPAARPAAPALQAPAAKERMLSCGICNTAVPKSQFAAHVAGHEE